LLRQSPQIKLLSAKTKKPSEISEGFFIDLIVIFQLLPAHSFYAKITSHCIFFTIPTASMPLHNSPWYRFFLSYSPTIALHRITIPVLALNGEYDWISSPSIIFPVVEQTLKAAGNSDYTLATLPKLNHSLQTCQTGSIAEYATLTETIAPQALALISDWITARTLQK
jgi:fermentation-respiration switch protein FrsA (DUF1100 family)